MLVALVALVVGIYALVDCLRTTDSQVRGLPVPVWIAVVGLGCPSSGGLSSAMPQLPYAFVFRPTACAHHTRTRDPGKSGYASRELPPDRGVS